MCMVHSAKSDAPQPPVPEELCRTHLNRMASGATFARAEQLRRLLRWMGDRSLTANPLPPTEKEIGEAVLRRKDFDPQTDSLVRKEMSRLRKKLMQYYDREGARERIRVTSAGGYLFRFVWSDAPTRQAADESESLLVLPVRSHPDLHALAVRLVQELLVRIGQQGGMQLVSPTTALSYLGRVGDVRQFAAECGADFVLEGSLELFDSQLRATLWLVEGRSGRTERPGRFDGTDLDEIAESAAVWLREQYSLQR
jgi:TolB-like protein